MYGCREEAHRSSPRERSDHARVGYARRRDLVAIRTREAFGEPLPLDELSSSEGIS